MLKISKTTNCFQIITIPDITIFAPTDLKQIILPQGVDFTKGVIIDGRMPVWVFCHIVHLCHPALWVATNDPRQGGGVVCQTHSPKVNLGDIIKL